MTNFIRTCLWFRDGRGKEAAEFYCGLIPGSRVEKVFTGDAGMGTFSVIDFTLGGAPYQILDAGPHFTLPKRCRSRSKHRIRPNRTGFGIP